ncbi:MAG: hypothetical protein MUO72_11905 [Bacteroidales bacterium]|nr:hypothetical protein [Bacteroidales bacterium]
MAALARLNIENFFLDLGPGLFLSGDYVDPTFVADIGYAIKLFKESSDKSKALNRIAIPIKITAKSIIDSDETRTTVLVPFTIGVGISYRIK